MSNVINSQPQPQVSGVSHHTHTHNVNIGCTGRPGRELCCTFFGFQCDSFHSPDPKFGLGWECTILGMIPCCGIGPSIK